MPFFFCGCQEGPAPVAIDRAPCKGFFPASIHVSGLTRLSEEGEEPQILHVFVELRDSYDSKIKAPATFRFDLYMYAPHRSDPRGRHVQTWPDFELLDVQTNHLYWRDYLRSYEFALEVNPPISLEEPFLLEVTCLTEEPKRLNTSYILSAK